MHIGSRFLVPVLACIALAGCGGLALMEARPFEAREPSKSFAEGRDERIAALIEEVIVPNGPSAWACDAQWDQYLIRLRSFGGQAATHLQQRSAPHIPGLDL